LKIIKLIKKKKYQKLLRRRRRRRGWLSHPLATMGVPPPAYISFSFDKTIEISFIQKWFSAVASG